MAPPAGRAETRNSSPPIIIFWGLLKLFSWMVMQKREPRRGDAKLGGVWGHATRENFAEFDLVLKAFCAF